MAQRLLDEKEGWENADFPIICETCLGPNPYVRMQKIPYGGACHISGRPYTVFRFKPGNDARYKKTVICQEVAKAKNVCQVCMLDLQYGVPVGVRDQALALQDEALPESDAGREYALKQMEDNGELDNEGKFQKAPTSDLLMRLARSEPYYKRNESRICSFFVKGKCNRGAACPYRHEMPTHTNPELQNQSYKDRYYGSNDPVAKKMLAKAAEMPSLTPPEDQTITTLFVGGLTPEVTNEDLKGVFYSKGELESLRRVEAKNCAFVTFATRSGAERAAKELGSRLVVKGARLFLRWGRPASQRPAEEGGEGGAGVGAPSTSGPSALVPPHVQMAGVAAAPNFFGLNNLPQAYYPSMDSQAMGTNPNAGRGGGGQGGRGGGRGRGPPGYPMAGAMPAMAMMQQQMMAGMMGQGMMGQGMMGAPPMMGPGGPGLQPKPPAGPPPTAGTST